MKQFIRNVRAAKTIADERAVVQKESAAIRASFREESHNSDLRYARGQGQQTEMKCGVLILLQTEQCRQTPLPLHPGRADTFWAD